MEQELMIEEESREEEKPVAKKEMTVGELPGVGPASIEKLSAAGFNDLLSVAVASPGEIVGATELSEATAKKIIAIARKNLDMGFETGQELMRRRERCIKLKTGAESFDQLLGGGIETGAITEAFGQYGSGKSQIAHVLAVRCQSEKDDKGNPGVAVFIDTEGTFRPERITQIAEGIGMTGEEALKNIRVARAFNSDHQMLLAERVEDLIKKEGLPVRAVIIDSLTSHFRAEYIGRGTLAERQQKINKHMHTLARLASMHNVAVYVTNQVMSRPDQFFGDPTEAIGGHIVGHNSTYRMYLRRGKKGTRVAKLVDSPNLAEGEAIYVIDEQGIRDA